MTDVFISYSSKDESFASSVYGFLLAKGLHTFMARHSINAGQKWSPEIWDALRSSDWVLFR